jgi:hypothetical protein
MKTRMFSLLLVAAMFMAHVPAAIAQRSLHDWSAVQAVAVDDLLIVKQKDGKTIEGKMIEASETNLTLSRDKKVVNISRDSIQEIQHSKGKAARGKWALIGAGIGAGAGAGIGAVKYSPQSDDSEIYIYGGTLIGAGAGAISGLLFGASRRHRTLIYTAP